MTIDKPPRQITGRMVLIGFIAFFGVVGAVNAVFMYLALSTWPGLSTNDAYKKGIAYNQTLAEADVQQALGWQSYVSVVKGGNLEVTLVDKNNAPLGSLTVEAIMSRPLGDERTFPVTLTETGPGHYAGTFAAPLPGRWKAEIQAHNQTSHYRMLHEVMIQP